MRYTRPLYVMIKPLPAMRETLVGLCAALGIEIRYSPDRWHCTLLLLGESSPAKIETILRAMRSFAAEPFSVAFDRIDGNTLQPRKGLRGPGAFQRALVRHLVVSGIALPEYKFGLHLNLAYGKGSDRRIDIESIAWMVDEILLIESVNGQGRHIEQGRWQLERRQGVFDFQGLAPNNPGVPAFAGITMEGLA